MIKYKWLLICTWAQNQSEIIYQAKFECLNFRSAVLIYVKQTMNLVFSRFPVNSEHSATVERSTKTSDWVRKTLNSYVTRLSALFRL